jgi:hypothetical protein
MMAVELFMLIAFAALLIYAAVFDLRRRRRRRALGGHDINASEQIVRGHRDLPRGWGGRHDNSF